MTNPFHAGFGVSPPLLVGRESVLADFVEALKDGPGSSGRGTLYTGARGAGKTVMRNAGGSRSRARLVGGQRDGHPRFIERMTHRHLPKLLRDFDPEAVHRCLKGLTAPLNLGRVDWDTIDKHVVRAGLRNQLEMLTDLLVEHSTGVLITLDEMHHKQLSELRALATTVQHAFRDSRALAFVGAGPAASVSVSVSDQPRRAHLPETSRATRHRLGLTG